MSKTKKFTLVFIIAIIVLLYAVVNNLGKNTSIVDTVPISTAPIRRDFSPKVEVQITNPINVVTKRDGSIDTQNWPVYQSADLGLEIKYPTGWGVKWLRSLANKDELVFLTFSPVPEDFFVGISISNIAFEEAVKLESEKNLISTEKINIGTIGPVLQITRFNPHDDSDVSYVFKRGNYTYIMRSSSDLGQAMLATLSFIP